MIINVRRILIESFLIPWQKRDQILRALFPLTLVLVFIDTYSFYQKSPWDLILSLISTLFITIFTIAIHRIIILDESANDIAIMKWTFRETRFYGWGWFIALAYMIYMIPIYTILSIDTMKYIVNQRWLWYLLLVPATYFTSRISLVLPATAIDKFPKIRGAWAVSTGNGWRLLLLVGWLPFLFHNIYEFLLRSNSSIYEVVSIYILKYLFLLVEIIALSLSYKTLTNNMQTNNTAII